MASPLERAQQPLSPKTAALVISGCLALAAIVLWLAYGRSSAPAAAPVSLDAAGPLVPCAQVHGQALQGPATQTAADWARFGYDAARSNAAPLGLTVAQVGRLRRQQVHLDGVVDASALFLHAVPVSGRRRDVLLLTSLYGRTEALDATSGRVLWRYTPPSYQKLAGSPRITNTTPLVNRSRQTVYTESPDGCVRALAVTDGRLLWATAVTRYPLREKLGTPLNEWHGRLIATTGGYNGDAPPYQGHLVVMDAHSGRVLHVWNSLCADQRQLLAPHTCPASDSAIWGRNGAVVRPNGQILVATGNGPYDGRRDWGDSALLLSPDLSLWASWTPKNQQDLNARDVDVGSVSPAIVAPDLVVQGGKDGTLRLLRLTASSGKGKLGGELQVVAAPGHSAVRTAPAVWRHDGQTWLFVGDDSGLDAWRLERGRLVKAWSSPRPATSPVVAGSLLYAYDPQGGLAVYQAASGRLARLLPAGPGHWQSPIVAGGRVYVTEGNGNEFRTAGVLDVYASR